MTSASGTHASPAPAPQPIARSRIFRGIAALLWLCVPAAAIVMLVARLWHDDLEPASGLRLLAHYAAFMAQTFLFHMGLACAGVMLLALVLRRWRLAVVALAAASIGVWSDVSHLLRAADGSIGAFAQAPGTLCVMSANLLYGRGDPAILLAQIERDQPDVLVFQEWTPEASAALVPLLSPAIAFKVEHPSRGPFGEAVFSRTPFVSPPSRLPPGADARAFSEAQITFQVLLDGRPLTITNIHLWAPLRPGMYNGQRAQARALHEWCASSDGARPAPQLLIGDFNAVHAAPTIAGFLDIGYREAHASSGSGRGTTWPRTGLKRFAPGVRIDHAIYAPELECLSASIGDDIGSDHRPIVARFRWKK